MSRPRQDAPPFARLLAEPRRFTFDAAVRLMTFRQRRADPAEAVRFSAAVGVAYPGAEVTSALDAEGKHPPRMVVTLMGLTGPSGVLPRHYSEAVVAGHRGRSLSLAGFLDLISNRLIAFFAAAGTKYQPHRAADTGVLAAKGADANPIAAALLALTGYGIPGFAERLATGAGPLQHYGGFFSAHPRSTERLQAMASDWLARPVQVQQFAGAWLPLPPDQRTRLPVGLAPGAFGQLGYDAAAGVRAWDQQARIVLRIGPLDRASFEKLLPDRADLRQLVSLVRAFVGFEVGFAINLVLAREQVPPLALRFDATPPARLGWNTWLPLSEKRHDLADAADALFEAEIVEAQIPAARVLEGNTR